VAAEVPNLLHVLAAAAETADSTKASALLGAADDAKGVCASATSILLETPDGAAMASHGSRISGQNQAHGHRIAEVPLPTAGCDELSERAFQATSVHLFCCQRG